MEDGSVDEWYDGFVSKVERYYEATFPVKRVKPGKPQKIDLIGSLKE